MNAFSVCTERKLSWMYIVRQLLSARKLMSPTLLNCLGSAEIFMTAVQAVQKDEVFQVESEYTSAALKTSLSLQEWRKQSAANHMKLSSFAHILIVRLRACFPCNHTSLQLRKERMWGAYHRLRTADTFVSDWRLFITNSIGLKAFPSFYQFVTQHIFKELMKEAYPVVEISGHDCESPGRPLTYEEQNALRYVAGYIIRKVQQRLETSTHPRKDEMVLLLMECAGDELSENVGTETWTNMIDRGGLWHINDQTYSIFNIMEDEMRRFFRLDVQRPHEGMKDTAMKALLKSDDLFEWCLIAVEADDDISTLVLEKIVELYVTVRGFAFAKSCMEMYKQVKKKTVQKSRALRSKLACNQ